jgi:flagellar secretion chaperone FliS
MTETPANAYLRTKVLTASPEELRLMLLDGAIKFASQGREGLQTRNHELAYNGISQCRNIVLELLTTIRPEFDPEMCERVKGLYAFMYTELVEASIGRDIARLDAVVSLLEYERETWQLLIRKLADERGIATDAVEAAVQGACERTPLSIEG